MIVRIACLALVVAAVGERPARACGGGFPLQRLQQRQATMATMPDGTFALEVLQGLIPPGERLRGAQWLKAGWLPKACRPAVDSKNSATEAQKELAYCLGEAARPLLGSDDDTAIRYYAQQALLEAELQRESANIGASGDVSLLLVGRQLLRDPARLARQWHKPHVQRLASLTLWSRAHLDFLDDNYEQAANVVEAALTMERSAARGPVFAPAWLAAGAYRQGRFALAERLLGLEVSPDEADVDIDIQDTGHKNSYVGHWLRAKLLVRRGQNVLAKQELLRAERVAPGADQGGWESVDGGGYRPRQRIRTERAIFALSEGKNADAFHLLWSGADEGWSDVAYLAERVLTLDELRGVVAGLSLDDAQADKGQRLRELLGRRLMRDGVYDEALVHLRSQSLGAQQYAAARKRAASVTDPIDRAAALFDAHLVLADPDVGIYVIGTEAAPDWVAFDGWGAAPSMDDEESDPPEDVWWRTRHETMLASAAGEGRWRGPEEVELSKRHRPSIRRFHYRYVASELAEEAASLVHPRSQAWAVLMCHATDPILNIDSARRDRLWLRYVKNGALLAEHAWDEFGHNCATPDFSRLRDPNWPPPTLAERQKAEHEAKWALRWRLVDAALIAAACFALALVARRVLHLALPRR